MNATSSADQGTAAKPGRERLDPAVVKLIVVLLTQAIALAVQVRSPVDPAEPDGPSVRLVRLWATATVTPFERAAHAIG